MSGLRRTLLLSARSVTEVSPATSNAGARNHQALGSPRIASASEDLSAPAGGNLESSTGSMQVATMPTDAAPAINLNRRPVDSGSASVPASTNGPIRKPAAASAAAKKVSQRVTTAQIRGVSPSTVAAPGA